MEALGVALQQPNHHVTTIPAGVPELKPLRDQAPLFGAMDRPTVFGTDTLARIGDVDFAIGGVELGD